MRRIFKPSPPPPWRGFSLVTDCQLEPQVASARPFIPQGGQEGGLIRRIGFIREPFERMRTEPKAKEHNNVVLSSRQTTKQPDNKTTKQQNSRIEKRKIGNNLCNKK